MLVLIVIAALVVVGVVVFLAAGRGGGLSTERNDYSPLDLGPVSATDVALLRPPTGLWGYNTQATDEALERIAEAIRERDVRIVALEQLVTDLSRRDHAPMPVLGPPYLGARHRREGAATEETEAMQAPYDFGPEDSGWRPATEEPSWRPATEEPGWRPAEEEPSWRSAAADSGRSPVAARTVEPPWLPVNPAQSNRNGDVPDAAPQQPGWAPTAPHAAEPPAVPADPAESNGNGDVPGAAPEEPGRVPSAAPYAAEPPRLPANPAKSNGNGDVPAPAPEESHD